MVENRSQEEQLLRAHFALEMANSRKLRHLEKQQERIRAEMGEIERRNAERSFAHWRQSGDGQHYLAWKQKYSGLIQEIGIQDENWRSAWAAHIRTMMTPEEIRARQTGDFIEPPRKHRSVKILLIAAPVSVALWLLVSLTGLIDDETISGLSLLTFWGSLIVAAAIALFGRKMPWWQEENARAKEQQSVSIAKRNGISPENLRLEPLSIWENNALESASRAAELIVNEVKHHPQPEELIAIPFPKLISEEDVPYTPMRKQLRSIRQKLKSYGDFGLGQGYDVNGTA